VNDKLFAAGLAMGLKLGGQDPALLKRIEAFKKEVEELGVEVKVTVNIGRKSKEVRRWGLQNLFVTLRRKMIGIMEETRILSVWGRVRILKAVIGTVFYGENALN